MAFECWCNSKDASLFSPTNQHLVQCGHWMVIGQVAFSLELLPSWIARLLHVAPATRRRHLQCAGASIVYQPCFKSRALCCCYRIKRLFSEWSFKCNFLSLSSNSSTLNETIASLVFKSHSTVDWQSSIGESLLMQEHCRVKSDCSHHSKMSPGLPQPLPITWKKCFQSCSTEWKC